MAEGLGLVATKAAELGVVSVEPGRVGSQVAMLKTHLVDVVCHKAC